MKLFISKHLTIDNFYLLSEYLNKIVLITLTLILHKVLSSAHYKIYGISLSIIGLIFPICMLAFDVFVQRQASDNYFIKKYNLLFSLFLILNIPIIIFLSLIIFIYNYFYLNLNLSVYVILSFTFITSIYKIHERILLVTQKHKYIILINIIVILISVVVFLYCYIYNKFSFNTRFYVLGVLYTIILIFIIKRFSFKFNKKFYIYFPKAFNVAKWIVPQLVFSSIYIYGDRIISSFYLDDTQFSMLFLVMQLSFLNSFIQKGINNLWQSHYFYKRSFFNVDYFKKLFLKSNLITFFLFVVINIYLQILYDDINGKFLLLFYFIGFILQNLYHFLNCYFFWEKKYNVMFKIQLFTVLFMLFMALVLYPSIHYKYFGIVFLATACFQVMLVLKYLRKYNFDYNNIFNASIPVITLNLIFIFFVFVFFIRL